VLAERPRCQRLLRLLIAASLLLALVAGELRAASTVAYPGGDPTAAGTDVAWRTPGIGGFLRRDGVTTKLPGDYPAIGATLIAWRTGPAVTVASRDTLAPVLQETLPGVTKLAVSRQWLAYSTATEIHVQTLTDPTQNRLVARTTQPGTLGRPALGVDLVTFHRATTEGSSISALNLQTGRQMRLRFSRDDLLLNPSVLSGQLLYVRVSRCSQQLRIGPLRGGRERVLYEIGPLAGQDAGHERHHTSQGEHLPCPNNSKPTAKMLWTTALSPTAAYVTVLRPRPGGRTVPALLALPHE
jgi:hypothetical protein